MPMLGFKKKKPADEPEHPEPPAPDPPAGRKEGPAPQTGQPADAVAAPKVTPRKITWKRLALILGLPALLAAGLWVGYTWFFTEKNPEKPVYRSIEPAYLTLPEEMRRFCFDWMTDLYAFLVEYEQTMALLDHEIERIDAIGQKYPDQQRIADTEKRTWERSRDTLSRSFSRIEQSVRELYVRYRVNPLQGRDQILSNAAELETTARSALVPAREQIQTLRHLPSDEPRGLIQKTVDTLKKMIL
jgi:hypothetical protein